MAAAALAHASTPADPRLIVPLDLPSAEEARAMVDALGEAVSFYKVGLELFAGGEGMALARELKAQGKQVFLDWKLHDIGTTVQRAAAVLAQSGCDFLTVHGEPQVMASAEAMKAGFAICKEKIPKDEVRKVGKVLLATVKGDVHDIGKNIVKMMLENHGFEVLDLGKDVPSEIILETAKREKPNAICLSALLTTTMVEMEQVGNELKKEGLNIPIMVGGADRQSMSRPWRPIR